MKTLVILFVTIGFPSFSQSTSLDLTTYNQLKTDLAHVDNPFVCPAIEGLIVERKQPRNSQYPKKEVIRMLNGRVIAKYKYEVSDGVLVSRKLKGQSMTRGVWVTGKFFYTGSGNTLSMVDYRAIKQISGGRSKVTEKVKMIKDGKTSTHSTNTYTLDPPPPPPTIEVFEQSTPAVRSSADNPQTLGTVSCRDYYNWYSEPYARMQQRFNSDNQLRERIFYDEHNRVLGRIRFHYSQNLLTRVELLDGYNRVIKQERISYDGQGNVINRRR